MPTDTATPFYLRQAAAKLIAAAVELEAQAGYHRERALGQIGLAERDIALCRRRIGRSLDASAETLRLQSERRQTRAAKL